MSPGALFLKTARSFRNLYQKEIAHLLGLNASTIACIESGHKNIDWKLLEPVIIDKLQLNERECLQLADAVNHSEHKFSLPLKTPPDKFYIVNEIFNQLDTMSQRQVDLIKLCLRLEDNSTERNHCGVARRTMFRLSVSQHIGRQYSNNRE